MEQGVWVEPGDSLSGQPESKHMPVRLLKWKAAWHAELFIRGEDIAPPTTANWSFIAQPGVTHFTLADSSLPDDWLAWLNEHYATDGKPPTPIPVPPVSSPEFHSPFPPPGYQFSLAGAVRCARPTGAWVVRPWSAAGWLPSQTARRRIP